MITYGRKSLKVLEELEEPLARVLLTASKICPAEHDFSLVEGHRPVSRQKELFDAGKSHIDGINKKGSHNYWPSKAFDVYPYLKGFGSLIPNVQCYTELLKFNNKEINQKNMILAERFVISKMSVVSGIIFAAAALEEVEILWGTDWDKDGNMLDHNFQDYPHHQLRIA